MNVALLICKKSAQLWVKSNEPPLAKNGRRKGYMRVTKELWDEMGYEHLDLSSQNLRDHAARLEKSLGNAASNIVNRVGRRRTVNMESNETGQAEISDNFQLQRDANEEVDLDLHSVQEQSQVNPTGPVSTLSQEACKLLDKATQLFVLVNSDPSEYKSRQIDTRTKEKPSGNDLENINKTVEELMRQNVISPVENPWIANCVLYSTVSAFLLIKGWKKEHSGLIRCRKGYSDKSRREFEEKATELRKRISIAKAEWERLRGNKKVTKKGRKNWALLLKECKKILSSELVNYMEKKKAQLRKLKACYIRGKKQGEARSLNCQFTQDGRRVYAEFNLLCDVEEARPGYQKISSIGSRKPGDFCSENQRPITCLNNIYEWFTSCPQSPIDSHLK